MNDIIRKIARWTAQQNEIHIQLSQKKRIQRLQIAKWSFCLLSRWRYHAGTNFPPLCCIFSMQWFGLIFIFCNLTLVIVTFSCCYYYCCYWSFSISWFRSSSSSSSFSVLLFVCIVLIRPAWIVYAIIFYILAAGGHKKRRYTRINKQAAKTKPLLNWLAHKCASGAAAKMPERQKHAPTERNKI